MKTPIKITVARFAQRLSSEEYQIQSISGAEHVCCPRSLIELRAGDDCDRAQVQALSSCQRNEVKIIIGKQ